MNTLQRMIVFFFLTVAQSGRALLMQSERSYTLLFLPGFERTRWHIGRLKAWRVFEKAKNDVPAYRQFLKEQNFSSLPIRWLSPQLSRIPSMDKESYVKKYSIESRCIGGQIPAAGVVIDESSGTSGIPNNWVRGPKERKAVKKIVQLALHHVVGDQPFFLLNAFALGPWATGMNVSMSLVDIAILKSVGPDVKKIENTLKLFGPKYRYLIMGYPPFLKTLVDTATIEWEKYTILAIFGGEGMSESMREYLLKYMKKLYGSYGASDLEINIASENDFTIRLRHLLIKHPDFAKALCTVPVKTLPMVFQYNPLDYYIETNEHHELLVTLCRNSNIAPKIRYNIHDLGEVIRMPRLKQVMKQCGIPLSALGKIETDLPLLLQYGRADSAVAFYGCKITPLDIQEVFLRIPKLATTVHSFSLLTFEDDKVNKKLEVALEMNEGEKPFTQEKDELEKQVFAMLREVNQDFRESSHMIPKGLEPTISFHAFGTGPFAVNDVRLKQHYIQKQ